MALFGRKKQQKNEPPLDAPRPDLVVPLIAGGAWMEGNRQMFGQVPDFPDGAWPFAQPFADDLWVTYAIDPAGSWQMIQKGQVDAYGGAEALHRTAMQNLAARVTNLGIQKQELSRIRVQDEPDLTASMILVHKSWLSNLDIAGTPLVTMPTRVELIVGNGDDPAAVLALKAAADLRFDQADGKPVSKNVYRLVEGTLERV